MEASSLNCTAPDSTNLQQSSVTMGPLIYKLLVFTNVFIIICLALVGYTQLGNVFKREIIRELVVSADGDLFNIWAEPPIEPLLKVCFYIYKEIIIIISLVRSMYST